MKAMIESIQYGKANKAIGFLLCALVHPVGMLAYLGLGLTIWALLT